MKTLTLLTCFVAVSCAGQIQKVAKALESLPDMNYVVPIGDEGLSAKGTLFDGEANVPTPDFTNIDWEGRWVTPAK